MRRPLILLVVTGTLLLVPVTQAFANEPLKVDITGVGSGKVFISSELTAYKGSPEINCSYKSPGPPTGVCETFMSDEGEGYEQVFLSAKAEPGSKFVGWKVENTEFEGCSPFIACAPYVEPPGEGTGKAKVIATFENGHGPSLAISKLGEGTVISSPAGISCGAACKEEFEEGETVTLTASPAAGWAFSAWSGCFEHVGLTCKVLMDKGRTIMVTFVQTPSLTIEKAGYGYGKVAAPGISCDESCSKSTSAVKTGTAVTVKATPAKGYEFAGFEGGTGNASSCSATCSFAIGEKSSLKARFEPIPTKTLTVNLTGPGAYKGKVTGKGVTVKGLLSTAIGCGSGCTTETETFFATGETELVAAASTGYTFAGWTVSGGSAGTCTGTTTPCKLLTDANKTVEAEFK